MSRVFRSLIIPYIFLSTTMALAHGKVPTQSPMGPEECKLELTATTHEMLTRPILGEQMLSILRITSDHFGPYVSDYRSGHLTGKQFAEEIAETARQLQNIILLMIPQANLTAKKILDKYYPIFGLQCLYTYLKDGSAVDISQVVDSEIKLGQEEMDTLLTIKNLLKSKISELAVALLTPHYTDARVKVKTVLEKIQYEGPLQFDPNDSLALNNPEIDVVADNGHSWIEVKLNSDPSGLSDRSMTRLLSQIRKQFFWLRAVDKNSFKIKLKLVIVGYPLSPENMEILEGQDFFKQLEIRDLPLYL